MEAQTVAVFVLIFWEMKGEGVTTSYLVSLCAVWDMVSQVSMLYMLLSLCMGWTLSRNRKPQSRPLQWEQSPASTAVAVGGVITQVARFSFVPHFPREVDSMS